MSFIFHLFLFVYRLHRLIHLRFLNLHLRHAHSSLQRLEVHVVRGGRRGDVGNRRKRSGGGGGGGGMLDEDGFGGGGGEMRGDFGLGTIVEGGTSVL
jgi:uncharacterized membrane protein YgcG